MILWSNTVWEPVVGQNAPFKLNSMVIEKIASGLIDSPKDKLPIKSNFF